MPSYTSAQKVGLVLSGGGAKGAAHIGVIKALEENDIPIDYITGTSAGAIVGSLYAMGYSPDDILTLFLSDEFGYWQTGTIEKEYVYYFKMPDPTPDIAHFSFDLTDSLQVKPNLLPTSLINPIQMNQAFMELYAQATAKAGWNFDNLFVPFRCIASDVYNKKPIIFRNGDLGEAVRASMTFPLFFKPIWKEGVPLFDGGIYDNFPVSTMKTDFHPDFIFGSAVSDGKKKPSENIYSQIETMIMQKTDYTIQEEDGIGLEFILRDVNLLDFQRSEEIMKIGYQRTLAIMDSIKERIPRRMPFDELKARREAYRRNLPPLMFKNIYITGVNELQRKYIESQLHRDINDEFSMEDFRKAYFKILSYSKIKEIIPRAVYNRKEKKFDLYLDVNIDDEVTVSLGGNVSSHQANQLYLGLGYRSLGQYAADLNADLQMGNSFSGALLNARFFLQTRIPSYVNLQAAFSYRKYSESQSLFYEDVVPAFIKQREKYIKADLGLPFLSKAKAIIGVGYGNLDDQYYQTSDINFAESKFDNSQYDLFKASFRIERNSFDAKQYPISGRRQLLNAQFITGTEHFSPYNTSTLKRNQEKHTQSWLQINAGWEQYIDISKHFTLGYHADLVLSSKNLLSNYTASVLQAPAFTPTPHSKILFNEAFRANQYGAAGLSPIVKIGKLLHWRTDLFLFAPLYEIKKGSLVENTTNYLPYYGNFLNSLKYMGETALVLQLPFVSVSLFVNGYSYPKQNFNVGLNIGYLIFNPGFLE